MKYLYRVIVQQSAEVSFPSSQGHHGTTGAKIDKRKVVSHFIRIITIGLHVSQTALSITISAPTLQKDEIKTKHEQKSAFKKTILNEKFDTVLHKNTMLLSRPEK